VVALLDSFWIKAQLYSLRDIFTAQRSDLAQRFVGGTVYQAFLEATSHHRWHAPVDGVVVAACLVAGTYLGGADSEQLEPRGPCKSLDYITTTATRAISDTNCRGVSLVASVFVGMPEVSSCSIRIAEGR
jgi:phosphatidylserine decarboxylase